MRIFRITDPIVFPQKAKFNAPIRTKLSADLKEFKLSD
jgi:hypothetical protein